MRIKTVSEFGKSVAFRIGIQCDREKTSNRRRAGCLFVLHLIFNETRLDFDDCIEYFCSTINDSLCCTLCPFLLIIRFGLNINWPWKCQRQSGKLNAISIKFTIKPKKCPLRVTTMTGLSPSFLKKDICSTFCFFQLELLEKLGK